MRVDEFDYELPAGRIAQAPAPERDGSRLLVVDRATTGLDDRTFDALPELLEPGDLLVLNDTRVRAARLEGRKPSGGRIELLLLEPEGEAPGAAHWSCLLGAARKPAVGSRVLIGTELAAEIVERRGELWRVRFDREGAALESVLERLGRVPLPPYIERGGETVDRAEDVARYQTIYARVPGAVAAPTAGLHFTRRLLDRLRERGVGQAMLTLHVGAGTFLPLRVDDLERHRMHAERFVLPAVTAEAVAATRAAGRRVVAVGTTVVRALEHCATDSGGVRPGAGRCDLFIYPGYRFRVVDALITNFHLPRSTLLMLVAALVGRERLLAAYRQALARGYRFYSFGDAMFVR